LYILIYGLGYVGLTAAGCLVGSGHTVLGVDPNEEKVRLVNAGVPHIAEPGLAELFTEGCAKGLLSATQNPGDAVAAADMALVCVGTPSAPDGSHNMSSIAEVSRQIAATIDPDRKKPLTVVYRSTMRPGATEELIIPIFRTVLGEEGLRAVEVVYNPEFLREASGVRDFFQPPKIVIGTADGRPSANMDQMNTGIEAPVFYTGYKEAELTKFVDNTWHATKVVFANEMGRICKQLGIDVEKMHEIFVSDTKLNVSAYYLKPGGAFGGSCLPKDVRALQHLAADAGANAALVDSLLHSNEAHKRFVYDYCTKGLKPRARVLLVGLSFKASSDDLRESPNVDLAGKLFRAGYQLSVYDPDIDPNKLVGQNLGYAYAHLPNLTDLLVSKEVAEAGRYEVVIDAKNRCETLRLNTSRMIDLRMLDSEGRA
jgi:GDP-mannose 6-dehydrogenase